MATFVEVTPDAFNEGFKDAAEQSKFERGDNTLGAKLAHRHVRRPVRGIQIKDDTYATLQVRQADGRNLPLFDAAGSIVDDIIPGGATYQNSNFLIQSITEQRAEKQQIVLTFGEPYIFFFGEQPRMIDVQGVLLNTADFNWRAEWWENYDKYLRGTQCVRQKARVYLSWDDIIVEGYITQAQASETSENRNLVQFAFQIFLTNYDNISSIGDPLGHLNSFQELDPAALDAVGSPGVSISKTSLVRQLNLDALNEGRGSLLDTLRSGDVFASISVGTEALVEVQGQVHDILQEAGSFLSGRNVRVPIGFQGSSAFDDFTISQASLLAGEIISGAERNISLSRSIGGKSYTVTGSLGRRTASTPAVYGPLSLNEDEFIARVAPGLIRSAETADLFAHQLAQNINLGEKIRDTFRAFGVDLEPPNELLLLATRVAFGIASVGIGSALNDLTGANANARFAVDLL